MVDVGIQLYSVHEIDDPTATILERVAETSLDGVEFFRIDDADAMATAVDETGLGVAGAHVGLDGLEDDFESTVDAWHSVGVDRFVVPWADPEHFASREAVADLATRLGEVADRLESRGFDLHYHNHDHEFVELDGTYALDLLAEEAPGVGLEPDLGWVGAAGADPLDFLERHSDRVDLVHVKDYDADAGEPRKVGEGDLDLDAVADYARNEGVDWLVYEYESAFDTYETIEHAGEVMPALRD